MKSLLLSFLLLFSVTSFANPYDFKITRVLDGDTVEFEAKFLPPPLKPVLRLRVLGVDTPEKGHRAQCPKENELGLKATELTKELVLKSTTRQIIIKEWDKFGGRVLGDLILDGVSLRDSLIKAGLAREYYGEAKQSWCN
jgi:endonuclease YncB( thermonuclease family)